MRISKIIAVLAVMLCVTNAVRADDFAKGVVVGVVAAPMVLATAPLVLAGAVAVAAPVIAGTAIAVTMAAAAAIPVALTAGAILLNPISLANKYLDDDCLESWMDGKLYGCNTTTAQIPIIKVGIFNKCPDNPLKDGVRIHGAFPSVQQCKVTNLNDSWVKVPQQICAGFIGRSTVPANAVAIAYGHATANACWGWACMNGYGFKDTSRNECVKVCSHGGKDYIVGTKLSCTGDGVDEAFAECLLTGKFGDCIATKCKPTHNLTGGKCVPKPAPKPTPPAPTPPVIPTEPDDTPVVPPIGPDMRNECEKSTPGWVWFENICMTEAQKEQIEKNREAAEKERQRQEAERQRNQEIADLKVQITMRSSTMSSIEAMHSGDKVSVWKDAEGNFNKARLVSDSIAGAVLGTAGGLITHSLIKKNQLNKGFEDIGCKVGGQSMGDFGDVFRVGSPR